MSSFGGHREAQKSKIKSLHASKKDTRTEEFFFSIISQSINYLYNLSEINHPVERGQSSGDQVHYHSLFSLFVMSFIDKNAFLYTLL